jgi:UDP-3-O-[3-hydroxymyristoyl] glucosamine N-acyltransferase
VGPNVVIGHRAIIGARVAIHAGVVIGDDCQLGDDSDIYPNVVIRERVIIGQRVAIHAGSVIGSDGFGYRWDGKKHAKVPQIGTVVIEDDVEIGSCVCIDRAKFGFTRVGRGTKIDNLVQIAHNVQIGAHSIIVGQTGIAGSVKLGTGTRSHQHWRRRDGCRPQRDCQQRSRQGHGQRNARPAAPPEPARTGCVSAVTGVDRSGA